MRRKNKIPKGERKWVALFLVIDLVALAVIPFVLL